MDKERIDLRSDQTFTYFHSSDYDVVRTISGTWRMTKRGHFITQLPAQDGEEVVGGFANLEWRLVVGGVVPLNGGEAFRRTPREN